VEVVPQPCGPRKLAKILNHCLDRIEEAKKKDSSVSPSNKSDALGKDQVMVPQDPNLKIAPRTAAQLEGKHQPDKETLLDKVKTQYIPSSEATAFPGPRPKSETIDQGTSLSLRTGPPSTVDEASQKESGLSQSQALHILVVDDNKINVDLLVKFVHKFKLTCEEAYNGKEAVDRFKQAQAVQRRFDYILMDISMPIMDGIEATRTIREFEEENHIERTPIFALSAFASADTQQEAKSNGVDIYLPKPVKFGQLKKLLLEKRPMS